MCVFVLNMTSLHILFPEYDNTGCVQSSMTCKKGVSGAKAHVNSERVSLQGVVISYDITCINTHTHYRT